MLQNKDRGDILGEANKKEHIIERRRSLALMLYESGGSKLEWLKQNGSHFHYSHITQSVLLLNIF